MTAPLDIATAFPAFTHAQIARYRERRTAAEAAELDEMFEVVDVRRGKRSDRIVSTSLYCKPHDPEKPPIEPVTLESLQTPHRSVRTGASWWSQYMEPLLANLERVPPEWTVRIHLAAELLFLDPWLDHPRVEVYVMRHPSYCTVPGMFWRYLPIDAATGVVMARGADALWPTPEMYRQMKVAMAEGFFLFRHIAPRDLNGAGFLVYKTVTGPILVDLSAENLGYSEAVKAWIWHSRNGLHATKASIPECGGEVKKFGMSHWARYGQDEQFLSHWLYHQAVARSMYTLCAKRCESALWSADEAHISERCRNSKIVYR